MQRGGRTRAYALMVLAFLGLATGIQPARAAIGAADAVAASTLLFPYFEVDLASPNGTDTLLSWHNASATAILSHVTVWTDLGYPVLTFNTYLTGFDVVSLDLRDALVNGRLPVTASAGQDYSDSISPKGDYSQDINFASCYGQFPYPAQALTPSYASDLRSVLSGGPAVYLGNQCAAFDHGDSVARGYVTVDTVNNCTQLAPPDFGYLNFDVTAQNTLAGEYFLVDKNNALMHQGGAVPIEASYNDPVTNTPGMYTFYGRLTSWDAGDRRESLPTTWAIDTTAARTDAVVWRDPKVQITPFTCGAAYPAVFPLGQESALLFDNEERPQAMSSSAPFPLAAQRVTLETPSSGKSAWAYLGLSYSSFAVGPNPPTDPNADQAYVTVLQYPESGATSTGATAISLDTGTNAQHSHPGP